MFRKEFKSDPDIHTQQYLLRNCIIGVISEEVILSIVYPYTKNNTFTD
jgi:hypothetical protein